MPEKNYYIAESFGEDVFTAGIVRKHQEDIMQAEGFKELRFTYNTSRRVLLKLLRLAQAVQFATTIPKGSTVYFHFPFLAGIYYVLQQLLHWRGIKTTALIIDIDGLRDDDTVLLKKELEQLGRFAFVVAHNQAMKDFIVSKLPSAKVLCMQLFDYQFAEDAPAKTLSNKICFAGNLGKSAFVYELHRLKELNFNLYGANYAAGDGTANVICKGAVHPSLLPAVLEGSLGLVWDGSSINTCNKYLRYNNPHKLSLYLAAAMPVIVWKDSAVASFLAVHKVGILVNALSELPQIIDRLSAEEYSAMQAAAGALSKKIKTGHYFRHVLAEIASL